VDRYVLAVLDGSARTEYVLPPALRHARKHRAELRLLHVIPPRISAARRAANRDAERAAWLYLITVAERLKETHPRVSCEVRIGRTTGILRSEADRAATVYLASHAGSPHRLWPRLPGRLPVRHPAEIVVVPPISESGAARPPVRSFWEDAARRGPLFQRSLGVRAVSLDCIVGSVGRARELEADFRPRSATRLSLRYRDLRRSMERGAEVPPVDLYKLDERYYILDGHHRVSIAIALGQLQIDAVVTEFVPMRDRDAKVVAGERRAFERTHGLESIEAVRAGTYPLLAGLIGEHAARRGIATVRHAAQDWYLRVYLPLERELEAANLWPLFPGDRSGDLVAHLARLKEAREAFLGRSISWDDMLKLLLRRCGRQA
jgi:nucleotide-binding universal stress UspA family protein